MCQSLGGAMCVIGYHTTYLQFAFIMQIIGLFFRDYKSK